MIAALPLVSSILGVFSSAAPAAPEAAKIAAAGGNDFGDMVSKMASQALGNVKGAETAAVHGIEGKQDLQAVVQSVMSAQESLQTALAIRDKAVAAFQEVIRMPM